jgi:hypothetical protein
MAEAARCDNCSTYADRPTNVRFFGDPRHLPDGWVRLTAAQTSDPAVTADVNIEVCTWHCAAEWLKKEANTRDASYVGHLLRPPPPPETTKV